MNPDQLFSRRAATMLSKLLNDLGYPTALLERAKGLSAQTKIDRDTCLQVLSGEVPWTWTTIERICSSFGKQPGFFLDDHPNPSIPVTAVAVPSAEGGETTVWCPPNGVGQTPPNPDAQLRHVTRLVPRLGQHVVGTYVFRLAPIRPRDLVGGAQYVIRADSGLEVATFEHTTSEAAIFSGSSEMSIHRIQLPSESSSMDQVMGEVLGLIVVR